MSGTQFIYDDDAVNAALARVSGADNAELMEEINAQMLYGVQRRFETETAPNGTKWLALKPATIKRRTKGRNNRGGSPAILRDSGLLYASLQQASDATSAIVGTNLAYAAIQQEGGVIQRYARSTTIRLRKVGGRTRFAKKTHKRAEDRRVTIGAYTMTIPARPYLGFSEADRAAMLEIAEAFYARKGFSA